MRCLACAVSVLTAAGFILLCGVETMGDSGALISVMDFGAVGDGLADDTAAIQAALDKAKSGPRGSAVQLPAGQYRVTKPITVDRALLKGLDAGGWPADRIALPTIKVDHLEGPCIIAREAASVHGVNFTYNHKDSEALPYGPTILLSGIGISITNVSILEPYEGIIADGKSNIGRLNIENVFMVSARSMGVYVTNTYDIATLRNVEVWNVSEYSLQHCTGFKLGKNDEIRLDNCFTYKCKIGYLLVAEERGVTWGGMTGSSADFCGESIVVEAVSAFRITGGSLWTHQTAIRLDGPGTLTLAGTDIRSNGNAAVIVTECDGLVMTGCKIGKSGDQWPTVPLVKLEGGGNVIISGCMFGHRSMGIVIDEKMDHFSITGNLFRPSPFVAITDNSSPDASKIIANNLIKKTEIISESK